jgi:ABC-type lipoprotein export system ATPase subunit
MGKVTLPVLKGVSLRVDDGSFVAVMGPSGAGKSTLLHLLAGLDAPSSGEIFWDGQPVSRIDDAGRSTFRNRTIGIVFQFYHLLPELSALENVMVPGLISGGSHRTVRERAAACLKDVGMSARSRHRPRELSGGEQQRVAIARALVNEPTLLLCDEPTGNLDSKTGAEVVELLVKLHRRDDTSLVLVTHQEKLAEMADSLVVLEDGKVVSGRSG